MVIGQEVDDLERLTRASSRFFAGDGSAEEGSIPITSLDAAAKDLRAGTVNKNGSSRL